MSDPNDTKSGFELVGGEPHAWLIEAKQLKRAADLVLPELREIFSVSPQGRPRFEDAKLFNSYMLLAGLALENLAKGILVKRNPGVVTQDKFILKGHDLQQLAQQVLSTLSKNELDILNRLTEFVTWAGRYPINLYAAKNVHPGFIPSTDRPGSTEAAIPPNRRYFIAKKDFIGPQSPASISV
jgi:hypothetical protein